jgi:hypothetical protein
MKRERRFLAALDDEGNMTEMGDKMAVRKTQFLRCHLYLYERSSFYQDRLGTNIGKAAAHSKQDVGCVSFRFFVSLRTFRWIRSSQRC